MPIKDLFPHDNTTYELVTMGDNGAFSMNYDTLKQARQMAGQLEAPYTIVRVRRKVVEKS